LLNLCGYFSAIHAVANLDMEQVPAHLKCPLSNTLLKEAVSLPCCNRVS
jgi:hypothetical protein